MKFLRILGHTLPFLILLSIMLLITLPFNSICIEVLYVLNFCFALYIFLYTHVNKKIDTFFYARIIQVFCVLTCAVAIATTRCFLSTTDLTKQIPFVLTVGQWICRDNYICGFFITLILSSYILIFCSLYIDAADNHATKKRYNEEFEYNKKINEQLDTKQITQKEATELLSEYHSKHYYIGEDIFGVKYTLGTIKAFIALYIVAVAGGIGVGILDLGMFWKDAINQYVMLASGYLVFFIPTLLIASLSFRFK